MSLAPPSAPPRSVEAVFLGRVVTLNPRREVLADGAVAVGGADIVAVGTRD